MNPVSLYLSDILKKVEIEVEKTWLARHALSNKEYAECEKRGLIKEYTRIQKKDFANGYEYVIFFTSCGKKKATLINCYRILSQKPISEGNIPQSYPEREKLLKRRRGLRYFELEEMEALKEFEGRLVIEWGDGERAWKQKATNEKRILSIQPEIKHEFPGYENLVLSFSKLEEIVQDSDSYSDWHSALKSIYAIYLIVDKETGKKYIGSAYGEDGLLGRWSCYVKTKHGGNIGMKEHICDCPDRYKHFQFSILQVLSKNLVDDEILEREKLYKKKLLTKEFGLNEN